MILNHIADCAGLIIERASALNSKVLRHSNLYALDLIAVPERFQNRILEADEDHVVHRPFSQVMIDAEDVLLIEGAEKNPIKLLRRDKVVTEGFFNDNASAVGTVCLGQLFHNQPEQRGRDGEVVRRPLRGAELLSDRLKSRRVLIVTINIAQQTAELFESRGIDTSPVFLDTVARPRPELVDVPTGLSYADNRNVEVTPFQHRLQRREDFFVSKIAGGAEKNQRIRMGNVHGFLLTWRIFPNVRRTRSASRRAACRQNLPRHAS